VKQQILKTSFLHPSQNSQNLFAVLCNSFAVFSYTRFTVAYTHVFIVNGACAEKMEDIKGPPNKLRKTKLSLCDSDKSDEEKIRQNPVLQGYHIQILEAGIGKVRSDLFRKKIAELGGTLCSSIADHPDVLIVDEAMSADRLYRLLKIEGPHMLDGVTVVQSVWLSNCIKNKKPLPTDSYELPLRSAVSSTQNNLTFSEHPTSQQAVTHAAKSSSLSSLHRNEDLEGQTNDDAEDDSLSVNTEATFHQQKPVPVRSIFTVTYHNFVIFSFR